MAAVSLRSSVVFLISCFAIAQCVSFFDLVQEEWKTFKLEHNKSYNSELEEKFRMKIFMENKNHIARHNALYQKGSVAFQLGLNPYADMLHHEFVKTVNGFNYTMFKLMKEKRRPMTPTFIKLAHAKVDDEVDWRNEGAVTPIKNQGTCGSCWAFSSTGSLEGQHFRRAGKLISLSEQNLIDCSHKFGNNGCEGGLMDNAFEYVKENHGIDTEKSYPYEAEDDKCRYKPAASGATDKGFHDIPEGDEEALKQAVATIGPISVAIDASQPSFQLYKKGVYFDENCSSEELDHGVLVVGYGTTDEGEEYWLVKNSWGTHWGESGYIKMARNRGNACGIASAASYPVV